MRVEEIMTKDPACCGPDTKLSVVARMMADRDVGQIPVVDEGSHKPLGVVTDRDITVRAVARGRNPMEMSVREVMSSPAVTITPEARVEDAAHAMEERRLRRMPVVAEDGTCCGMISQADIALHASGHTTAEVVRKVSQPVRT